MIDVLIDLVDGARRGEFGCPGGSPAGEASPNVRGCCKQRYGWILIAPMMRALDGVI